MSSVLKGRKDPAHVILTEVVAFKFKPGRPKIPAGKLLEQCLNDLSAKERTAFRLRHGMQVKGEKFKLIQVARWLNCSEPTASRLITRATQKLRRYAELELYGQYI
jgi:DNA-directed RNA polymerase specialized sigma24 family protein